MFARQNYEDSCRVTHVERREYTSIYGTAQRVPFLAREEWDEAVQRNTEQEQDPSSQKASGQGKESSGKTSHSIHSWTDGHDLNQSIGSERKSQVDLVFGLHI